MILQPEVRGHFRNCSVFLYQCIYVCMYVHVSYYTYTHTYIRAQGNEINYTITFVFVSDNSVYILFNKILHTHYLLNIK